MGSEQDSQGSLDIQKVVDRHHLRRAYREPFLNIGGWITIAVLTVLLAIIIRTFIFQSYKIPSESMLPTLEVGDHILVNKLYYSLRVPGIKMPLIKFDNPGRGDVVVFRRSDKQTARGGDTGAEHFIKRIVGVPGNVVEIRNEFVYVNGEKLHEEDHIVVSSKRLERVVDRFDHGPVKLEMNEYFVLGDNRANSRDSRFFGPVKEGQIQGRAFLIYWSWDRAS